MNVMDYGSNKWKEIGKTSADTHISG